MARAKRRLVENVQALPGSRRLNVADGLPECAALVREREDFRVTSTSEANQLFGAGLNGGQDDLVVAHDRLPAQVVQPVQRRADGRRGRGQDQGVATGVGGASVDGPHKLGTSW